MGRDKTLGSLESFLRYTSNYLGAPVIHSTECFLLFPSRWWVTAVGCELTLVELGGE